MKHLRRKFLHLAASVVAVPVLSGIARAQAYPTRPVRWIIGFPPGGAPDLLARMLAQGLSERLGQQFIIDNRPGAGSNIAAEAVVRASPDGYTLLLIVATNTINATLYDKLSFNFVRDIVPVASIGRTPFTLVVNPSVPVDLVHVPYRGSFYPDLLAGQVQVIFTPISGVIGYIRTGQLRALAVTSAARSPTLPDIPTVGEFVPGYEASGWEGIGAPKNTPPGIIDKLNKEVNAVLADAKMKADLANLGDVATPMSPADFGKFVIEEAEKWNKVIRAANIKPE
jgi:tripartite-type tricarboxylate transporter receptor subunit TctC